MKPAVIKTLSTRTSDDDLIIKHLFGKLERTSLSPKLQEKIEQMDIAKDIMAKYKSRLKCVPMFMRSIKNSDGTPISQATAYRLFNETQRYHGEANLLEASFYLDIELGEIEEDIQGAKDAGNWNAVARLRTIRQEYILKAMVSGNAALYEKIQPPEFVIGFFPKSMKVALPKDKELNQLVSEKLKQIAEDVDIISE